MLEKLLQQLGLGDKEQTIYKLILEYQKITPSSLARYAKLQRTTVYSVAKELKEKGLIIEDLGGKTLSYFPTKGNELNKLIQKEQEKTKEKEAVIHELQSFLKNIPESKTYSVPKIRFIDEIDLEDYLHEATPRWIESMLAADNTWWGFQDPSFVEKYEKWVDWFWSKAPTEINLKLLTNESQIEQKMVTKEYNERRQMKFIHNNEFTATQSVVGSYVIYIMTKQKPYYLVEIHDSVIAHNSRELFKNIWNNTA